MSPPEPRELHATRKAQYGVGGSGATVSLICPESDAGALIELIVGENLPWPYPGPVNLYATDGMITPWASAATEDGQGLVYDEAKLDITYSALENTGGANPTYYSEACSPNAESWTLPPEQFSWSSTPMTTNLEEHEAPSKIITGFDYLLTVYNQVSIPAHHFTHQGKVNSGTVASTNLGFTFPAETLLFSSAFDRTVSLGGSNRYTMNYRFHFRPSGWNKYWRVSAQDFAPVYYWDDGSVNKPYATVSFSGIVP
jgi:hypothetical protein